MAIVVGSPIPANKLILLDDILQPFAKTLTVTRDV